MNEQIKPLFRMMAATLLGLAIVTVMALVIHFNLSDIVDTIFPHPSPTPLLLNHGIAVTRLPDPNFGVYIILSAILWLLNGCIGSFTAQFLFRHWEGLVSSQV